MARSDYSCKDFAAPHTSDIKCIVCWANKPGLENRVQLKNWSHKQAAPFSDPDPTYIFIDNSMLQCQQRSSDLCMWKKNDAAYSTSLITNFKTLLYLRKKTLNASYVEPTSSVLLMGEYLLKSTEPTNSRKTVIVTDPTLLFLLRLQIKHLSVIKTVFIIWSKLLHSTLPHLNLKGLHVEHDEPYYNIPIYLYIY